MGKEEFKIMFGLEEERDNLKEELKVHAVDYSDKPITLRSGKESCWYVDCRPYLLTNEGHRNIGRVMGGVCYDLYSYASAVAATGVGGCYIASAIVSQFNIDLVHIRPENKSHGKKNKIELPLGGLEPDDHIIIVDDVLTTGSSLEFCIQALREEGFQSISCVVLLDREDGGPQYIEDVYGIRVDSVFVADDLFI